MQGGRALLVLMMAFASGAEAAPELTVAEANEHWQRVLERFVDARGRVDFRGLAEERADLDTFTAWVAETGPQTHPNRFPSRDEVIAFHINAYNALAMREVLEAGLPASLGGLRKFTFFFVRQVRVDGESRSFYGYENDVIRPLGEARVHFALNCMSVGCPRLPREPFTGERLDVRLERLAREFLAEQRNVSVDQEERQVTLSEIFDFYTEDFLAEAPTLFDYVNRYVDPPVPVSYDVRFSDFDWRVNYQHPPGEPAANDARRPDS